LGNYSTQNGATAIPAPGATFLSQDYDNDFAQGQVVYPDLSAGYYGPSLLDTSSFTPGLSDQTALLDPQPATPNFQLDVPPFGAVPVANEAPQAYEGMQSAVPAHNMYPSVSMANYTTAAYPNQPYQGIQASPAQGSIPCTHFPCPKTFKREPDRVRHEESVHGINQLLQLFVCPVLGCPKSVGEGYTRKDKLTEHLWKKHGNLGFVKQP
jgi:hypothetical protein